jgi:predicted metal-dependent hydrolase
MALLWSDGELAAGLDCYRREEFFDAHEHWENVWRESEGAEKPFLQALIQVAAALHHYRRNNLRGTAALLRGALRKLEACPERFGGLLLGPLRQELCEWLQALEAAGSNPPQPPAYPAIRLDLSAPGPDQPAH